MLCFLLVLFGWAVSDGGGLGRVRLVWLGRAALVGLAVLRLAGVRLAELRFAGFTSLKFAWPGCAANKKAGGAFSGSPRGS